MLNIITIIVSKMASHYVGTVQESEKWEKKVRRDVI